MTFVEGDGQIAFARDEFPPLTDVGFWSVTAHGENALPHPNAYDLVSEPGSWKFKPGTFHL